MFVVAAILVLTAAILNAMLVVLMQPTLKADIPMVALILATLWVLGIGQLIHDGRLPPYLPASLRSA